MSETSDTPHRTCIIGISGKLGQYMLQHCLDRGHEVVGVCREQSVHKLDPFLAAHGDRITLVPGPTNDPDVVRRAVAGCDGVLTVLVPWGVDDYSSGTAQAVLDHAEPEARDAEHVRMPKARERYLVRHVLGQRRKGELRACTTEVGHARRALGIAAEQSERRVD